MRFKVRLEVRRHWLLNSLRWGDSLMRRPSPTLKRVVSPFGSRQRGVTRKPHKRHENATGFGTSRLGERRILRQIRARIARWSREDKSRSRRQTTHPEWHTLRHGKATCLPWRILYQLYASQIDAATNNVAFSCGFVRFSCLTTLPRPEG